MIFDFKDQYGDKYKIDSDEVLEVFSFKSVLQIKNAISTKIYVLKTTKDSKNLAKKIRGFKKNEGLNGKSVQPKKYISTKNCIKKAIERSKEVVLLAKSVGCKYCGEMEAVCLDFHHRDPLKKDISISRLRGRNVERIKNEIDKCDVLCANCHRKLHAGKIKS